MLRKDVKKCLKIVTFGDSTLILCESENVVL